MAATNQPIKTSNGVPIPQWYDAELDDYVEAVGSVEGGGRVQLGALPYADRGVAGTGAAVAAAAANPKRAYLLLQAPDTNGSDAWVNATGGTAAAGDKGSLQIKVGGGFEWSAHCPSGAISVLVASGDVLLVWEG